jgi:hypothetical protein
MTSLLPTERASRRHKGSTLLSPRDRWSFRWIAEQYTASLEQLQALLGSHAGHGAKRQGWISKSAARQVLARWHKLGYIEQKNIFTDYPAWIWLTRRAIAELGLPYGYYTPHFATLPHLHAINHVRLSLELLHPNDIWKPERQLKSERPRYAAGWEPPHTPDAEMQSLTTQEITAIEVELSVKKPVELKRILTDLSTRYSSIWYFALEAPYRAIREVLSELDADAQEKIYTYELEHINAYTPITI